MAAEVKARLDVDGVYAEHLALERKGARLWARCPFHGGGHERTPSLTVNDGKWWCFACNEGGDVLAFLQKIQGGTFSEVLRDASQRAGVNAGGRRAAPVLKVQPLPPPPEPCKPLEGDLPAQLKAWQAAFANSPGDAYLNARAIPTGIAMSAGMGFASSGWPGKRLHDRPVLVFPLTDAAGTLVSMAARSLGRDEPRWDFLPDKPKAPFLGESLAGSGPLWMVEGAVDALALKAAGVGRVVAMMGSSWAKLPWNVRDVVLALDADDTGLKQAQEMARRAALMGKRVRILPPENYGGRKDVSEAWQAGTLTLYADAVPEDRREEWAERVGIMLDAGAPLVLAEQAAIEELGIGGIL